MPASNRAVSSTPRRVDIPGTADLLNLKTVGGRIAWARIQSRLRQEDVAKKLGKSRATIVQYEKDNIRPPSAVLERLAKIVNATPEFLAFARQGVDALRSGKAEQVVTMPEMHVGGARGLFETGGFAMPKKIFEDKDINIARTKFVMLEQDDPEFGFAKDDHIVLDQSINDIEDSRAVLFLIQPNNGKACVMRREANGGGRKGEVSLTNGHGVTSSMRKTSFKVLGGVKGMLSLA